MVYPLKPHYPSYLEAPRESITREVDYPSMTAQPHMASSPAEIGSTSKHTFLTYSMTNLFVRIANFDETSWLASGGHIDISCVVAWSFYDCLSHMR